MPVTSPGPADPNWYRKHLQVVLEPLDGENEGIFFLSLSRPEARNSIGRQFLRVRRGLGAQVVAALATHGCACHTLPPAHTNRK